MYVAGRIEYGTQVRKKFIGTLCFNTIITKLYAKGWCMRYLAVFMKNINGKVAHNAPVNKSNFFWYWPPEACESCPIGMRTFVFRYIFYAVRIKEKRYAHAGAYKMRGREVHKLFPIQKRHFRKNDFALGGYIGCNNYNALKIFIGIFF